MPAALPASSAVQNDANVAASVIVEEIYNAYMAEREPELMTDVLPHLPYLHAADDEETREETVLRHEAALDEFEEFFGESVAAWNEKIRAEVRAGRHRTEEKDRQDESGTFNSLQQSFS